MLHIFFLLLHVSKISTGIPYHLVFDESSVYTHTVWKEKLFALQLRGSAQSMLDEEFYRDLFKEFMNIFERSYKHGEEYHQRFQLFKESLKRHTVSNEQEKRLNGTAKYGINKFADWSKEEFENLFSDVQPQRDKYVSMSNNFKPMDAVAETEDIQKPCLLHRRNPDKIDWRKKITAIKDQKSCGSCWAFVGAEQVETYWAITGNPLMELSPQELLSCSPYMGCEGGNTCAALRWLIDMDRVLVTEKAYPYEGKDSKCQYRNLTDVGPKISHVCGCRPVAKNEEYMLYSLSQKGPLGVNVDAVLWRDYIGGIIQHHCTNRLMNHAVQLVAYYLKDGPVPYYVARNQWGRSFGEDGFVRIKYGGNVCGVAQEPSFIEL